MTELEQARMEIDQIDAETAALFERRMQASARIAAWKREHGQAVLDPAREAALCAQNEALLRDPALLPYYRAFFRRTLELSRARQQAVLAPQGGAVRLDLLLPDGCCPIRLRRGLLSEAGQLFDLRRRVLIVTDDGVPPQYAQTLAAQCGAPVIVTLPQGEVHKTLAQYERLLRALHEGGFTRDDCVCAVGGGVVCDLAGFAAATYLRGVDFYGVPTTLLSQLDAAVGGKNGCDFGGVKNQVGTIRQPAAVLIDPALLESLPPRQLSNGLAEAVKAALLGDAALLELLEHGDPAAALPEIVARALRVKLRVVAADERESGLRKTLNLGHTLGHGLEAVTGLLHGECVALGMLPMCGEALRARLLPLYGRLGLPTAARFDPDAAFAAILHDKKSHGDTLDAVLVDEPGVCRIERMPLSALRARLDEIPTERSLP